MSKIAQRIETGPVSFVINQTIDKHQQNIHIAQNGKIW